MVFKESVTTDETIDRGPRMSTVESGRRQGWELGGVTLAYAFMAALFTYPLLFRLNQPYSNAIDFYQNLWDFWWVKKALLELHQSPFWTSYLFYPTGTSLAFQAFGLGNCLLSIPLQFFTSLVAIHNLLFWVSSVLIGIGTYLLVKYLTGNRLAAFIAGVIYANCPYHQFHYWQLPNPALQWVPLYMLFLLKTFESGTWKNTLLASLFFVLTVSADTYQMLSLIFMTALLLFFELVADRRSLLRRGLLSRLAVLSLLGGLGVIVFYSPALREALAGYTYFERPVHMGLMELLGMREMERAPFNFWPVVFGYVTTILVFLGVFFRERREGSTGGDTTLRGRIRYFWILAGLFFFLMVQGAHPTIMGREIERIPLPMHFTNRLPILAAVRSPHRFLGPLMLVLSVLAGYGLSWLLGRIRGVRLKRSLTGAVLALIVLEYLAIPLRPRELKVDSFYQTLRKDPADYALLETPFSLDNGYFTFLQTVHEKRLIGGYISRNSPGPLRFIDEARLLRLLASPAEVGPADFDLRAKEGSLDFLRRNNIRYVIVHKDFVDPVGVTQKARLSTAQKLWIALAPYSLNVRWTLFEKMGLRTLTIKPEEMKGLENYLNWLLGSPIHEDRELAVFKTQ